MDIKAYLERIGLSEDFVPKVSYDALCEIHLRHVLSVPYENLDIINKKPLSLDAEDVFKKVVEKKRGGYCFELNALITVLLKELGFEVESYLARFLRGADEIPFGRHRVAGVKLDGNIYICDVGMGQSAPRIPLKLVEGEIQEQFGECYRYMTDERLGWVLYDLHNGEWRRLYSFTLQNQFEIDFVPPSFHCEKHSDSIFNKTPMVALKTADGRITVNDREYKEFCGNELLLMESNMSDERLTEILKEKFGLEWKMNA